jgi:[citrate (pro-3S)-lyase] ligase
VSGWLEIEERSINLGDASEVKLIVDFLSGFELSFDENVEYTVALYSQDVLVATGSFRGKVIRNVAVSQSLQGEGLLAKVVSHLMQVMTARGQHHYFVFTKPEKSAMFTGLGFVEIARVEPYVALLEMGICSIQKYCRDLQQQTMQLTGQRRAALVVNCNPFTYGHHEVIARAATENDAVIVFVVSSDLSLFPFDVRFRLVKEGVEGLKNVVVVPGGDYIISSATFPGYFTRGEDTVLAQTRLDATVFGQYIAPALGIVSRYVGEEPYCAVTAQYNASLAAILPEYGVAVKIIPRLEVGGELVSASKVREMIRTGEWQTLSSMVPETTYQYLRSPEAAAVVEKIRSSASRH